MSRSFPLIFFILAFHLISCSKKEEKIPAGIIPKDKMVQVMVDIHIAEARSQVGGFHDNSGTDKQSYYRFIFTKYKITYQQLMASWTFYSSHPEIFSVIYSEVITELSKDQAMVSSRKQQR